jgi:hypothetical protein
MQNQSQYLESDFEKPGLFRDLHCCAFIQSILFWGCFIGCLVSLSSGPSELKDNGAFIGLAIASSILYLLMILVSCCSDVFTSLKNTMTHSETTEYLERMKMADTYVVFHAEAYHHHTVIEKDGDRERRREQKVTTWTHREKATFSCVYDQSRSFMHLCEYNVPILNLICMPKVMLSGPAHEFVQNRIYDLENEARWRDTHYRVWHEFDVDGRLKSILSLHDDTSKTSKNSCMCCFSKGVFWFITFLGLTWVYRMWYNTLTYKIVHNIVKYVSFEQFIFNQDMACEFRELPPPIEIQIRQGTGGQNNPNGPPPQYPPSQPPPQYPQSPQYQPPQYPQPTQYAKN